MSVFANSDERILIEEIVEATAEDQDTDFCGIDGVDESSIAAVTLLEVTAATAAEHQDHLEYEVEEEEEEEEEEELLPKSTGRNKQNSVGSGRVNGGGGGGGGGGTPRSHMEQEKRMRREIANSNERRRMQSINAGFQSLRTLLPHHEGEKLSKAAILQQTAEYIYQLEQQKTHLLSQNCQLKRLLNQHEGGDVPIKKRKTESMIVNLPPMHVSENGSGSGGGDEGLDVSMSPESLLSAAVIQHDGHSAEILELKRQLERERLQRLHLEKQMRAFESQIYPERFHHEVIDHASDNIMMMTMDQETEEAVTALQVVSVMSIPPVGSTQTVETTPDSNSPSPSPSPPPSSSPPHVQLIAGEKIMKEETAEIPVMPPGDDSPKIVAFSTNTQIFTAAPLIEEPPITTESSSAFITTSSPTRPFSPVATTEQQRLPSVLEAAMKAEPKVEVERLPSPPAANSLDDGTPQARLYLANTSRQNLETIVEAIRHLEGDHLFSDEPAQDMPLALTNKPATTTSSSSSAAAAAAAAAAATLTKERLHAEVNSFLQFRSQNRTQQQRPGVIVVKHS